MGEGWVGMGGSGREEWAVSGRKWEGGVGQGVGGRGGQVREEVGGRSGAGILT